MELICFLSIFTEYFYLELEAENEINLKNAKMESEHLKAKLKSLEDILQRIREEEDTRNRKAQDMIKEVFKPSVALSMSNTK